METQTIGDIADSPPADVKQVASEQQLGTSPDNETDQTPSEGATPPEEGEKPVGDETTEESDASSDVDEPKPVPYSRFKEVISERQALQAELEALRAKASDPDVAAAIDLLDAIRSNPERALKELVPVVDHLKQLQGDELAADLKEAVQEGTITKEYARELTQARLKSKATATALQQTREERARTLIASTWNDWDRVKRKTDPDFQPGTPKWQYVDELLKAKNTSEGLPTTQAAALERVELLYAQANKIFAPKRADGPRKVLQSTASRATKPDPTKMGLLDFVLASLPSGSVK